MKSFIGSLDRACGLRGSGSYGGTVVPLHVGEPGDAMVTGCALQRQDLVIAVGGSGSCEESCFKVLKGYYGNNKDWCVLLGGRTHHRLRASCGTLSIYTLAIQSLHLPQLYSFNYNL